MIGELIAAIVIGIIAGYLGRALCPGRIQWASSAPCSSASSARSSAGPLFTYALGIGDNDNSTSAASSARSSARCSCSCCCARCAAAAARPRARRATTCGTATTPCRGGTAPRRRRAGASSSSSPRPASCLWALVYLHVVVLPIIIALLASTLLLPVVRWLKRKGAPDALAAAGAMLAAFLLDRRDRDRDRAVDRGPVRRAAPAGRGRPAPSHRRARRSAVQPQRDGDPGPGRRGASRSCARTAGRSPAGCPAAPSSSARSSPALLVALLLTFFFLKDGERMWGYLLRFTGRGREHADELGTRVYAALSGYIRGHRARRARGRDPDRPRAADHRRPARDPDHGDHVLRGLRAA